MASPLITIPVVRRYVDAANRAAHGHILLVPVYRVSGAGWVVVGTEVRLDLRDGVASGEVIVNQPALSDDLYLRVTENIVGEGRTDPYVVRPDGTELDLNTAPHVVVPPPGQLYVPASALGQPGGVATLGPDGLLTLGQRPPGGGGGGVTAHAELTGLGADDHTQYVRHDEGDAAYAAKVHTHGQADVTGLAGALAGKEAAGTALSTMAAHVAEADPHPQYLTGSEGDAAYASVAHTHVQGDVAGLAAALAGKEGTGTAAAAVAAHVAEADPHPQYLTGSEGDAAYASVAHTHTFAQVPGLTAALDDKEPAGAADAAVDAHVAEADPHPQYATDAQLADKASRVRLDRVWVMEAAPFVVPNTGGVWTRFEPSGELTVTAAAGDDIEVNFQVLTQALTDFSLDLATITGAPGAPVRYFSTAGPVPGFQGLPCAYPMPVNFQPVVGSRLGLTVQPGDLDGGQVRVAFAVHSINANGRLHCTTNYPLIWSLHNNGPAAL